MSLDIPAYDSFVAVPLGPTLGAEVEGVDLGGPLGTKAVEELRAALTRFKVLFFRGQAITQDQFVAFGKVFGPLELHPITPSDQPNPEVLHITHGPHRRGAENAWHSDVSWSPKPSHASVLRALEVPEVGGDTLFCDMVAAYEGLSDAMKRRIEGLRAVHDILKTFGPRVSPQQAADLARRHPRQLHPVVRTIPQTGERLIYVNLPFTRCIEGLSEPESSEILEHLYSQADLPEYQVRFRWRRHSIAVWDNTRTQHYAVSDYYPNTRTMERVTVAGERPASGATPLRARSECLGYNFRWNPPQEYA